jgi:hypothetical protein
MWYQQIKYSKIDTNALFHLLFFGNEIQKSATFTGKKHQQNCPTKKPIIWVNLITTSLFSLTGNHGLDVGNHPLSWPNHSGEWNMIIYPDILGIVIPTDELIFFRGVGLNHQPVSWIAHRRLSWIVVMQWPPHCWYTPHLSCQVPKVIPVGAEKTRVSVELMDGSRWIMDLAMLLRISYNIYIYYIIFIL